MADVAKPPWSDPLRRALQYFRWRRESYPLLKRVTHWWAANTDNQPPRAVFNKANDLWPWPSGAKYEPVRLPYSFFCPVNNTIQRNRESKVQAVIKLIEERVPGVKFVRVKEDSEAVIRIAFDHKHPDGSTWSRVGRDAEEIDSDKPTMNLSDVTGHDSGEIQVGSDEYIDIVHEFFHSLGMRHEHQHPERKFTISKTAVQKGMKDDGWSEENIVNNIVRKLGHNEVGAISPPDNLSCMNYRIHPEWTKEGLDIKKSYKPSDIDWAFLNLMYPPPPREKIRFERALSKCGINLGKEDRGLILGLYLEGNWVKVRSKIESVSNPKKKPLLSKIQRR